MPPTETHWSHGHVCITPAHARPGPNSTRGQKPARAYRQFSSETSLEMSTGECDSADFRTHTARCTIDKSTSRSKRPSSAQKQRCRSLRSVSNARKHEPSQSCPFDACASACTHGQTNKSTAAHCEPPMKPHRAASQTPTKYLVTSA